MLRRPRMFLGGRGETGEGGEALWRKAKPSVFKKNRLGTMKGSFGHYFQLGHYSGASRALAWHHPHPPSVLKHLQLFLSQWSLLVLVACSLPVSVTFLWLLQLAFPQSRVATSPRSLAFV